MNKDIINSRNQYKFSGLLSLAWKEKIKVNYSHLYSIKYRLLFMLHTKGKFLEFYNLIQNSLKINELN